MALVCTCRAATTQPEQKVRDTVNAYLKSLPRPTLSETSPEQTLSVESMLAAVSRHKDVNDETRRIWKLAEGSAWAVMTERHKATIVKPGSGTLIVIIPPDMDARMGNDTKYFYNTQDRALYMSGRTAPDIWIAQIFFHEYGHSLQHQILRMEDGLLRETLMHTLSIQIIESGVRGYREKIRGIALRGADTMTFKDAVATVSEADLLELDTLIFGRLRNRALSGNSVVQHLIAIGFSFADEKGLGIESKKQVYDWVDKLSPN